MIIAPPQLDARTFGKLLEQLRSMAPHYTAEWRPGLADAGDTLLNIHAFITEMIITRLNQVPRKSMIAFLNMLGLKLLEAQPALVPVMFKTVPGRDQDVLVPARTQVRAAKTEEHEEVPFETKQNLLAVASNLREVIGVVPANDAIFIHTANVLAQDGGIAAEQKAFNPFAGQDQQEHSLYLGHQDLLNLQGPGEIRMVFTRPPTPGAASVDLVWEYWGEDKAEKIDRWLPLEIISDNTAGLAGEGEIVLAKKLDGEIKQAALKDIFSATGRPPCQAAALAATKNRWVRGRLRGPLSGELSTLMPTVGTLSLRTAPGGPVPADAGFYNDVPIDWSKARAVTNVSPPSEGTNGSEPDQDSLLTLPVDSLAGFAVGDRVEILMGEDPPLEARIAMIKATAKQGYLVLAYSKGTKPPGHDQALIIRTKNELSEVYVFGNQPKLNDAFYLASQEAFSKKGAMITLNFTLGGLFSSPESQGDIKLEPKLSWEYWNGKGWWVLPVKDGTGQFLKIGDNTEVQFVCPQDMAETEVYGQKNYWIRTRIIGGHYLREDYVLETRRTESSLTTAAGQEYQISQQLVVRKQFQLPIIRDLTITYAFSETHELEVCLSYNNLELIDQTLSARTGVPGFPAFIALAETVPALYLGFDKPLRHGPIRIFFAAAELHYAERQKPKILWQGSAASGWLNLDYLDETEGWVTPGHLEFIGPTVLAARPLFGTALYWLRGGLEKGLYATEPLLGGIFPNTTWAGQAETIRLEILGSSNGEPHQTMAFLKTPVLRGEEVRVREVLSAEERHLLQAKSGAVLEIGDETGAATEIWVLWTEVADFADSDGKSRHYLLDRALGVVSFGDGQHGMIPPPGQDNVKAFAYQTGGGAQGNVAAGEIKALVSSVAGLDKVVNPLAADGGADTATIDEMLTLGPAMLSNRGRAVTTKDYEWLARQASRKVKKVKCLASRNRLGQLEAGWVTVIIVPDTPEPQPSPSLMLKRVVASYLAQRSGSTIAAAGGIVVIGPTYVKINLSLDLIVATMDLASETERQVQRALADFLHPLSGGPEKQGWHFGRGVALSDVAALLEGLAGVDAIAQISFQERPEADFFPVGSDALVANGDHRVNLRLP